MPQAERILRQKIRIEQIREVLKHDKGIDLVSGQPLLLTEDVVEAESYDDVLNNVCRQAQGHGYAAATIQHCIHVGVGCSEQAAEAKARARQAAQFATFSSADKSPLGIVQVRTELLGQISEGDLYKGFDLLRVNLYGMADRPFPTWGIERDVLLDWITHRLSIYTIFDLSAFIWLGKTIGLNIGLASKKTTGMFAAEMGGRRLPRWGGHALRIESSRGEMIFGGGMFGHIIGSMKTPLPFMLSWTKQ